jgi:hypothetical protein
VPGGPIDLALQIAALLDSLAIPYVLGGSLASSLVGEPRTTVDLDFAIRLRSEDVAPLLAALGTEYYVSSEAVQSAVARTASFNIVKLDSVEKVDLFVLGDGLLDRRQLARRQRLVVSESPRRELWVGSPEDQVLRKLDWYRAGGGVSDRQWRDVLGILAVQAARLDRADLESAAADLGLAELLARAFQEAGVD